MDLKHLPDELLLKILEELKTEPDVLLNIVPLLNRRFRELAKDSSLWREFNVPDYWPIDVAVRFCESHPTAPRILDLRCSDYLVYKLSRLPASPAVSNVQRLSLFPQDYCESLSLGAPRQNFIEMIPLAFPNLIHLKIPMRIPYTLEQLQNVATGCPSVRFKVHGISNVNVLKCFWTKLDAVELTSLEALQEIEKMKDQDNLLQLQMCLKNRDVENFDDFACGIRSIGYAIRSITLECQTSLRDIFTIAHTCTHLRLLHLRNVIASELAHMPAVMPYLEDLTLLGALPHDQVDSKWMSAHDMMSVINSCPRLRTLSMSFPGDPSKQIFCTLPRTLRSFKVLGFGTDVLSVKYLLFTFLEALKPCFQLRCFSIEPYISDVTQREMIRIISTKARDYDVWSHLSKISLSGFIKFSEVMPLLENLIHVKAPITDVHLVNIPRGYAKATDLKIFTSLPLLRDLHLGVPLSDDVSPEHLKDLGQHCPLLESLYFWGWISWEYYADMETTPEHYLQRVKPLFDAFETFERLRFFGVRERSFLLVRRKHSPTQAMVRMKTEKLLNAHYRPWRSFTVTPEFVIVMRQCPPACRTAQFSASTLDPSPHHSADYMKKQRQ